MAGVYSQIIKDLREGRAVLYSGLSCQVAGVLSIVPKRFQENLFTIDTICGGLSTMLPMQQLQKTGEYLGIHSFRNKDTGWKSKGYKYALKLYKKDESICDLGTDNMMIQCFCHKETKRSSCLECHFNGFHRPSDATIGDFWGDTRFVEQHKKGLSVLITHSNRLGVFLKEAPLHLEAITWSELVSSNPSYYWSHYSYIRNTLTRRIVFRYIRLGNSKKALMWMNSNGLLRKMEYWISHHDSDFDRQRYLNKILQGEEK
jgi:hypothetical protein